NPQYGPAPPASATYWVIQRNRRGYITPPFRWGAPHANILRQAWFPPSALSAVALHGNGGCLKKRFPVRVAARAQSWWLGLQFRRPQGTSAPTARRRTSRHSF